MNPARLVFIPESITQLIQDQTGVLETLNLDTGFAVDTVMHAIRFASDKTALYGVLAEQLSDGFVEKALDGSLAEHFDAYYEVISSACDRLLPQLYVQDITEYAYAELFKVSETKRPYYVVALHPDTVIV